MRPRWASRGLRSPARDSLPASLAPRHAYGRAFGLERAGDNLGAVVGPLLAALLVSLVGVRETLYFAALPGLFAAAALTIAGREAHRTLAEPAARRQIRLNFGELHRAGMARALLPVAMFEVGNVAVTLLILRATQTGRLHDRVASELACPVGRVGRMSLCRSRIRKSSARVSCGSRGTAVWG